MLATRGLLVRKEMLMRESRGNQKRDGGDSRSEAAEREKQLAICFACFVAWTRFPVPGLTSRVRMEEKQERLHRILRKTQLTLIRCMLPCAAAQLATPETLSCAHDCAMLEQPHSHVDTFAYASAHTHTRTRCSECPTAKSVMSTDSARSEGSKGKESKVCRSRKSAHS